MSVHVHVCMHVEKEDALFLIQCQEQISEEGRPHYTQKQLQNHGLSTDSAIYSHIKYLLCE